MVFDPVFFHPAPPLFRPPDECPGLVQDELKSAWPLFWVDASACANRLRGCIEVMLTEHGVPRSARDKNGKMSRLRLHARIDRFRKKEPAIAVTLEAIKWLGNEGSHTSDLTKEALLDGVALLQYAMDELYARRTKRLERLATTLNKSKGRRRVARSAGRAVTAAGRRSRT